MRQHLDSRGRLGIAERAVHLTIGQTLTFQANASDPDETNRLSFSLSGAPEGASIDPSTGEFRWTPTESDVPRLYEFRVKVTDDREKDKKSVSRTVEVMLTEDTTRFTYLIGIVSENGQREAWLYDISTRKQMTLKEGMPFEAAGLTGFVFVIGNDFLEFQSGSDTWRLALGKNLRDREKIVAAAKTGAGKKSPENGVKKSAKAGAADGKKTAPR